LTATAIHHTYRCIWCTLAISNTTIEKWTINFRSTDNLICWSLITIACYRWRTVVIWWTNRNRTTWWISDWLSYIKLTLLHIQWKTNCFNSPVARPKISMMKRKSIILSICYLISSLK
jgi:hypothetical protein